MQNVKFASSFRFKLIITLLLIVQIPLITLTLLLITWVKDIIGSKYSESALQSIRQSAKNIDFTLADLRNYSNGILTNKNFINLLKNRRNAGPNDIENMLRSFFTSGENIEGMYVYSGPDSFSIGSEKVIQRNEDAEWFRRLLESEGEVKWINTRHETIKMMSGSFDKYFFSLGRKLMDIFTFEELGILLIDVDESILEDSYKSHIVTGDAFICDREGNIISHTNKEKIGKNISFLPYIKRILELRNDYGKFSYKNDQMDIMVIYSTLKVTGWKLINIVPTSYLYQEINNIKNVILITGIALIVCVFIIALFLSDMLTKPMVNLMRTMKQAENGDLDVKIDIKKLDEIGQLGICFNNMILKIKTLIEKIVKEEKLKKEIELEALHAQINPHFLYNTLNSIKWMAKIQGAKNISLMITALTKLLRVSINLSNEMIYLKEEIEYVKNYIFIQKIRFNEQFEVKYSIEECCNRCKIPKLILQPIVENSIVHGFDEEYVKYLRIKIKAYKDNEFLIIKIIDNGSGIRKELLDSIFVNKNINKFSTVGLNNVKERIHLYFGDRYGINIRSKVNFGTCVKVILPYILD